MPINLFRSYIYWHLFPLLSYASRIQIKLGIDSYMAELFVLITFLPFIPVTDMVCPWYLIGLSLLLLNGRIFL